MLEIKTKYKIGDYIKIVDLEEKYRVLGYEYMEGRGLRYVVQQGTEIGYFYESQIEIFKDETSIGFIPETS